MSLDINLSNVGSVFADLVEDLRKDIKENNEKKVPESDGVFQTPKC